MLYWPAFEFDFRLDMQRLLPHLAAIEGYREAASNCVLPPPWREQPAHKDADASRPGGDSPPEPDPISARKQDSMIRNAGRAQAWVRSRFAPGNPAITWEDVLTMHRMVADETGVYTNTGGLLRTSPVQVGRREVGGLHAGAPAERLPRLMEQYVGFVNGIRSWSLPAVVHALVAHFFFTTIHPFDDGNGRLSRLVAAAILFQRGYNGHGFYALSNYFYVNDVKYHTLLHSCWQKPLPFELTEFVAFGMEGLVAELQSISSFLKMKLHRSLHRESVPRVRQRIEARRARMGNSDF